MRGYNRIYTQLWCPCGQTPRGLGSPFDKPTTAPLPRLNGHILMYIIIYLCTREINHLITDPDKPPYPWQSFLPQSPHNLLQLNCYLPKWPIVCCNYAYRYSGTYSNTLKFLACIAFCILTKTQLEIYVDIALLQSLVWHTLYWWVYGALNRLIGGQTTSLINSLLDTRWTQRV